MKTLAECKNYYIDVFTTNLIYRDHETETQLKTMQETLSFVYPEFKNVVLNWNKEALNNYYSRV